MCNIDYTFFLIFSIIIRQISIGRKIDMFAKSDVSRNKCMLFSGFAFNGYDWWWHNFTGINEKTGEKKTFFIEYYLCNPGHGRKEAVLGQLEANKNKGIKPSYLMVKAGCWGEDSLELNKFYGWGEIAVSRSVPYSINCKDCFASENSITGMISIDEQTAKDHPEYMTDAGSMYWNLKVSKNLPFNVGYGASKLFRDLEAFEMYWHVEGMRTLFDGEVVLNGVTYKVIPNKCYGYADKNWGRDFTSPWLWLSSNNLKSRLTGKKLKGSAFDIGGGCPKIYMVSLKRKLLGAFYYRGEEYEYNFSKFWDKVHTRFRFYETDEAAYWYVAQENLDSVMITKVKCQKKDMIYINYESPDGMKRHNKLLNGGTGIGRIKLYKKLGGKLKLIDDIDAYNVGCEYGEYDE